MSAPMRRRVKSVRRVSDMVGSVSHRWCLRSAGRPLARDFCPLHAGTPCA
jgi:hypothetical protein